jgi:hypothetical protein
VGVGFQLGVTYVPRVLAVNLRYSDELSANGRFQGQLVSGSIAARLF